MRHRIALGALVALAALFFTGGAWAHAIVSPPVVLAQHDQVFTLAVPTEKDGATTTSVVLTTPAGFDIDSFVPSPGWKRSVAKNVVTWTGGAVPTGEDAAFSFVAGTSGTGDYTFSVRQTYSDGSVVTWSGPESSDAPAPIVRAVSSFGGGTPAITWLALGVGVAGLVAAGVALLARGGRELA
ncbi:MAG: DUF1775 domain-containing protein [Actinomycetota bacterium]